MDELAMTGEERGCGYEAGCNSPEGDCFASLAMTMVVTFQIEWRDPPWMNSQ